MILSGWFAAPEKPRKLKTIATRLVLPVFSWYLILYVAQGYYRTMSLVDLAKRWVIHPDVGLWFLWVLFLCHLWLVLVRLLEARIGLTAYLVGALVLYAIPFSSLGMTLAKYYFPFFALGYLTARYWQRLVRYSYIPLTVSVLIYPLAFRYWHLTSSGLSPARAILAGHELNVEWPVFMAARLICALSGSVIFAFLLSALASHFPVGAFLGWLGAQTLEIYAIHQSLIPFALGHGSLAVITSLIFATVTSLGSIWLLRKNSWASLLLFGRIPRSKSQPPLQSRPDSSSRETQCQ
jgi:hypothetical protein